MAKIYFKDEQGKKVSVEVTDEVEKQYRESLQEEWRGDAYDLLQDDIQLRNEHDKDLIRIGKNSYEERKDAGALLIRVVKSGEYVGKTVGFIKGFKIVPQAIKSADLRETPLTR